VNASTIRDFTENEVVRFCELARSTDYKVRFMELMPLDGTAPRSRTWC
jgi:molybdenum cofactor biosynthesis enzyme MoaA